MVRLTRIRIDEIRIVVSRFYFSPFRNFARSRGYTGVARGICSIACTRLHKLTQVECAVNKNARPRVTHAWCRIFYAVRRKNGNENEEKKQKKQKQKKRLFASSRGRRRRDGRPRARARRVSVVSSRRARVTVGRCCARKYFLGEKKLCGKKKKEKNIAFASQTAQRPKKTNAGNCRYVRIRTCVRIRAFDYVSLSKTIVTIIIRL